MRYLVLECALSFAVVLDEEGRVRRVPNLGYAVGEVREDIYLADTPIDDAVARRRGPARTVWWLAAAACLCAAIIGGTWSWQTPRGTVHLEINPSVAIEVNRFDRVVGLAGENADGEALIEGYWSYGKEAETVVFELTDRAADAGDLAAGGAVALDVASDDEPWRAETEERLIADLSAHVGEDIMVARRADIEAAQAAADELPEEVVVEVPEPEPADPAPVEAAPALAAPAPAPAPAPTPEPTYSDDSGYGNSGYSGYDD